MSSKKEAQLPQSGKDFFSLFIREDNYLLDWFRYCEDTPLSSLIGFSPYCDDSNRMPDNFRIRGRYHHNTPREVCILSNSFASTYTYFTQKHLIYRKLHII